jgi:Kef-type K+ transport system membrane component KefB
MTHLSGTELLLLGLLIIFALPWLFWRLLRTDYFMPLVVVQIGFGVLLGPGVFGALSPALQASIFTSNTLAGINAIAMWAVMLFVCLAGIELDLKAAWQQRVDTLSTATLALICPLILGTLAAQSLLWLAPPATWMGVKSTHGQFMLAIGMSSAITALPILVLFLSKLHILHSPLGQRVLRYASLDDLAIWAVLALILLDFHRLGQQLAYVLSFAIAAPAFRSLMRHLRMADRWPVALMWLLLNALAADACGLHFMVGAFIAGVVIDADSFERAQLDQLREYVLLLLMPVFFLSTGLRTSWSMGTGVSSSVIWIAAIILLVAAVAGKWLGVQLAARLLRWGKGEASLVAWLLQTKALIMIIFANILLDRGVITSAMFTALLLMALMSTMLTIPIVTPRLRRYLAAQKD